MRKMAVACIVFAMLASSLQVWTAEPDGALDVVTGIPGRSDDEDNVEARGLNGVVVWETTLGGRSQDVPHALSPTDDGGYIVVGETYSYDRGGGDAWLVKVDADGRELWNVSLGGGSSDYGFAGVQTSDGGYVVTGGTASYGAGGHDAWLVKVDADGRELWNQTYGGESWDQGYAVRETAEGGYVVMGGTMSYCWGPNDYWLIRTDGGGRELWNRTYGRNGRDWGYAVIETGDGGYLFTGGTDVSLNAGHVLDLGLYKTDGDGDLEWRRLYNRPVGLGHWDEGYDVRRTADGGYIVAGLAHTTVSGGWDVSGGGDGWLIKTDAAGAREWDLVLGGTMTDMFTTALPTPDGGYVVAGSTYSYARDDEDAWVIKVDESGATMWDVTLPGGMTGPAALGHILQVTADGGYLVACTTRTMGAGSLDVWLVKLMEPTLHIETTVDGGLAVRVVNTGGARVNVSWTFEVLLEGFLSGEWYTEGSIPLLEAGGEAAIQAPVIAGVGVATVRVTADGIGKTDRFLLLGSRFLPLSPCPARVSRWPGAQ